jgi:hypothetical protein
MLMLTYDYDLWRGGIGKWVVISGDDETKSMTPNRRATTAKSIWDALMNKAESKGVRSDLFCCWSSSSELGAQRGCISFEDSPQSWYRDSICSELCGIMVRDGAIYVPFHRFQDCLVPMFMNACHLHFTHSSTQRISRFRTVAHRSKM